MRGASSITLEAESSRGIPRTALEGGNPVESKRLENSLKAVRKRQDSVGTVSHLVCVIRNGDCQTEDGRELTMQGSGHKLSSL